MLSRPLEDLREIAKRDDWEKFLDGNDFREMVEEIARLRGREKARLRAKVCIWKDRIGRLEMMSGEIARTPGAEHLIQPSRAAVQAITTLILEFDQTLRD
jgi:hypothetical protein